MLFKQFFVIYKYEIKKCAIPYWDKLIRLKDSYLKFCRKCFHNIPMFLCYMPGMLTND